MNVQKFLNHIYFSARIDRLEKQHSSATKDIKGKTLHETLTKWFKKFIYN